MARVSSLMSAVLPKARPAARRADAALAARRAPQPLDVAAARAELLSTAVDCGAKQVERFATSRVLVASVEQKRNLGNEAEAVEMESYTILAEAARYGVPSVAVRAISDTADFDMPYNFERACDERGQIRVSGIIKQVLRHPSGLPALLTLARDCRTASRHLANFLDVFAGTLGDRLVSIEPDAVAAL